MIVQNQNNLIAQTHENKIIDSEFVNDGGLKFDNVNDYVNINSSINAIFPSTIGIRTYKFFLKPDTLTIGNEYILISRYIDLYSFGLQYIELFKPAINKLGVYTRIVNDLQNRANSTYAEFNYINNNIIDITVIINTINPTLWKVYINSILINNPVSENNLLITDTFNISNKCSIGMRNNNNFFNGQLFDLKVFNKELTPIEVAYLNGNKQLIPSSCSTNCILDMRFNDKQGTTAKDKSGNNYHGSLVNYAAGTTDLGVNNSWKDQYGNAILTY